MYTARAGVVSWAHYNGRGDVVTRTSGTGSLTYAASYEAFGTRTQEAGTNPDRQRANTKEEDPTGLLNEGFRYRDLELGMFISRDPAGFVDGPNVYTYVVQNPWSAFDPEGLWGWGESNGSVIDGIWNFGGGLVGGVSNVAVGTFEAVKGASEATGEFIADVGMAAAGNELAAESLVETARTVQATAENMVEEVKDVAEVVQSDGFGANFAHEYIETAKETFSDPSKAGEVIGEGFGNAVLTVAGAKAAQKLRSIMRGFDAPDGGFTADLSKTKAKSRSGHSNAGNQQLHEAMKKSPRLRKEMERRFGLDVFERTSPKGGRRNPRGAEWDHNSKHKNRLDLRSKENHAKKTRKEGQKGGGHKRFHKNT